MSLSCITAKIVFARLTYTDYPRPWTVLQLGRNC